MSIEHSKNYVKVEKERGKHEHFHWFCCCTSWLFNWTISACRECVWVCNAVEAYVSHSESNASSRIEYSQYCALFTSATLPLLMSSMPTTTPWDYGHVKWLKRKKAFLQTLLLCSVGVRFSSAHLLCPWFLFTVVRLSCGPQKYNASDIGECSESKNSKHRTKRGDTQKNGSTEFDLDWWYTINKWNDSLCVRTRMRFWIKSFKIDEEVEEEEDALTNIVEKVAVCIFSSIHTLFFASAK